MTRDSTLTKVAEILKDILDSDSPITVTDKTVAKDIPEWDSLNNIQIIIAIEKFYKIKFKTAEIQSWENVGEMCASIEKYANAK